MRISVFSVVLAAIITLLPIGAARAADPIRNYEHEAIAQSATSDQVRRAFMAAGALRGWTITESGAGELHAVYAPRDHVAEVTIQYSATEFSILYSASTNLDYKIDKQGVPVIHKNYNRWIANLRADTLAIMPQFAGCSR